MNEERKLVRRADKVPFMKGKISTSYNRMQGFTSYNTNKNPKEYTRQYIDQLFETTDLVGMSVSVDFGFDQYIGDPVHDYLTELIDNEVVGTDAVVEIIVVDFTKPVGVGYKAMSRKFAVIPNTEGDSFDAYTYSGTFRVNSEVVKGTASATPKGLVATFTPTTEEEEEEEG